MYIPTTTLLATSPLSQLYDSGYLGADAASIDTGAILPLSYNVLQVMFMGRTTQAAENSSVNVNVNGDASAFYDRQLLRGSNATTSASQVLTGTNWQMGTLGANAEAGAVTAFWMTFFGYAQTIFHKTGLVVSFNPEDTASSVRLDNYGLRWKSTAAINQVSIAAASGNLLAGSRLLIYGY